MELALNLRYHLQNPCEAIINNHIFGTVLGVWIQTAEIMLNGFKDKTDSERNNGAIDFLHHEIEEAKKRWEIEKKGHKKS
jgi:hypothetical protein